MAIPRKTEKKTGNKTVTKTQKNAAKPSNIAENSPENTENPPENDGINPNLFSISALSRKFKLDRATIRERLEKNEIKPNSVKSNEKLYLLEDVEFILMQSELNDAKFRKLDAEAEIKALELKKKSGEYGSVAEFTEITQKIFSRLYKKVAVQLPARIASRLHNANSTADVGALLKAEISKEFNDLRTDFKSYLDRA